MAKADIPRAKRKPEQEADAAAQETPVTAAWPVRAWRALRTRGGAAWARTKQVLLVAATAAIDKGIASLQRLRTQVPGTTQEDEDRADDDVGARRARRAKKQRPGEEPPEEESPAPKPRRRVRAVFIYLSVMLAGAMGGTALAHNLFEHLLDRRAAELERRQAELTKQSKAIAGLQQKLKDLQALRTKAEASLAQNEQKLVESQQKSAEAEAKLATLTRRASYRRPAYGGAKGAGSAGAGLSVAGDCTVQSGNIAATLGDCIAEMNSR